MILKLGIQSAICIGILIFKWPINEGTHSFAWFVFPYYYNDAQANFLTVNMCQFLLIHDKLFQFNLQSLSAELLGIPRDILERLIPEHARKQSLFMALHV